jgi:alpha-methylacyl-CoA racemase
MGPLAGVKMIEIAGIGPGPFCGMMLSDLGADVIRIERVGAPKGGPYDVMARGRPAIQLDLKSKVGVAAVLALVDKADAIFEGFRPGVMERLGLGPEVCLARRPQLVYGRMTGWGQEGPLAPVAGHDINYIALIGALWSIGRKEERPVPPLNLVGDFGGGGMLLAVGILAAMLQARASGKGQVVDAAMIDGAALLMAPFFGMLAGGRWQLQRNSNMLDGAAPFYDTFTCADGKWVAIGSIEPQFYALLIEKSGADPARFKAQHDRAKWPEMKAELQAIFKTKTREEWCRIMEGSDVCFAPVLDLAEAPRHPHNAQRRTFVEHQGVTQPAPAPRFGATPTALRTPAGDPLAGWGLGKDALAMLREAGVGR